jgi:choline-glycine betaine transporter
VDRLGALKMTSGAMSAMSTGGVLNPRRATKLTWGVIMGAIAAILLVAGGLDALQNGAILAATPFAVLMLVMCWALLKALRQDFREEEALEATDLGRAPVGARVAPPGPPRLAGGAPPAAPTED